MTAFDPFKTGQIDLQYNQARELLENGLQDLLEHGSKLLNPSFPEMFISA